MCHYLNLHKNHKLLKIDDEKALKKENLSIEDSSKELNENKNKIEELKKILEEEIIKIDKAYEKVDKETTKAYEIKHEKLIKEENELKEKLKNEVTKIKENLELNLSKINDTIRNCERIMKGMQKIEKEEQKMIKKLNYVSKINKNQKEMKSLFQQLMKNIKISFDEKESDIKYEEYYFSGLQIPKDIKFSDINYNSFKMSWKIDDIKIKNIDNKQIKYKIEIKKENDNKFIFAYEGNDNYCTIKNLIMDTNYEIRICSLYNNLMSIWAEINKIKTTDFLDSIILNKNENKKEYISKIFEWTGFTRMDLLFRGTKDGMNSTQFHNKCDNKGKTIYLFLNDKGNIFGAYSSIPWTSNGGNRYANDCFLFTLTNIYNIQPTKFPYVKDRSVYQGSSYGPLFGDGGHDLNFYDDFTNNSHQYSNFPCSYQDTLNKGKSIFTGDFNNSNIFINLKEIEVFEIA